MTNLTTIKQYVVDNNIPINDEKISLSLKDIEKMIDYFNQSKNEKKGKNEKNKKKIVYDKNEFPIAPNGWCGFV